MKVLALDPGGTTGWATFEIRADTKLKTVLWEGPVEKHFTESGQLAQPDHHRILYSLLVSQAPDIIVSESFQNRNNDFANQISMEYQGVIKLYDQTHKHCRVHWNTASTGKGFATNKKLVHLNIMLKPSERWKHANDARRHLLQYLVFNARFPLLSAKILYELRDL